MPIGGMMMSFTRDATTAAKATPMMNARARASTFVLIRKALNSVHMADCSPFGSPFRAVSPEQDACLCAYRYKGPDGPGRPVDRRRRRWYAVSTLEGRVLID